MSKNYRGATTKEYQVVLGEHEDGDKVKATDNSTSDHSSDTATIKAILDEFDEDEPISPYDLLIPYNESDDDDDFSLTDDSIFVDSGWSGECLQDLEDIDFEFVYALHTFVATVEGQANATKGDTMVLLDDSNSYWWLVRVVKDSSIGMSYSAETTVNAAAYSEY